MSEKARLKSEYVILRKTFDRKVQRCKRLHWFSLQSELEQECNIDYSRFWKSIGKIGVNNAKRNTVPIEIITQDGPISNDIDEVLQKWKADFSDLLNCNFSNTGVEIGPDERPVPDRNRTVFDDNFSILEIKKAVGNAKRGKSCGFDQIPSEVLNNDVSIYFLHVLFNACFSKGVVPAIWGKCVNKPIPKSSSADPRDPLSYRGIALGSAV